MRYPEPPKTPAYQPEKPNHTRTAVKTLFLMLVYHATSWLIYDLLLHSAVVQMTIQDDLILRARWILFAFSMISLLVIASVLTLFYAKDGERKRAFLAATSVEVRGSAQEAAEGLTFYRRLARKEALICTLSTGALWLIPTVFYAVSRATSGMGYGYGEAWGLEKLFVSFVGLCEPFQSAWAGWLLGAAILLAFHYGGRLYIHKKWNEERIRK
jgi:hypothetical protein